MTVSGTRKQEMLRTMLLTRWFEEALTGLRIVKGKSGKSQNARSEGLFQPDNRRHAPCLPLPAIRVKAPGVADGAE